MSGVTEESEREKAETKAGRVGGLPNLDLNTHWHCQGGCSSNRIIWFARKDEADVRPQVLH